MLEELQGYKFDYEFYINIYFVKSYQKNRNQ